MSMFGNLIRPPPQLTEEEERGVLGYDVTIEQLVNRWRDGEYKNVVVCVGAGVSVSAGIPDFRTPGTGLYDNLQRYNLPNPEAVFTLDYFKEHWTPFYELAKAMYPGTFKPTPAHYFIRLLQDRGMLLRCYTQNVDTLERQAGLSPDLLVEAHGSFADSSCIDCRAPYSMEWFKDLIFADQTPRCEACHGLVKPSIVFFGEALPRRFFELSERDCRRADLVIVMGTSLKVFPFAGIKDEVHPLAPRLLINRDLVGLRDAPRGHGFRFHDSDNYRDVALLDDCDRAVAMMAEMLGWSDDLRALLELSDGPPLPPPPPTDDMQRVVRMDWRAADQPLPPLLPVEMGGSTTPLGERGPWRCVITEPDRLSLLSAGGYLSINLRMPEEEAERRDEEGGDYVTLTRAGETSAHRFDDYNFAADDCEEITFKVPALPAPCYEVFYVAEGRVIARFGPIVVKRADEEKEAEPQAEQKSEERAEDEAAPWLDVPPEGEQEEKD